VWLIIPLIYFLGWWQTGSLRQALNGTIAWIIAFSAVALTLLAMDVGGFSGMTATPDSPAAAIAILGGFIGMWISNYIWRRRGGDPVRKHGKLERSFRAMFGMNGKKKSKKKQGLPPQPAPPPYYPPPPQQPPVGVTPVDAQYRPVQQPGPAPEFNQQPPPPQAGPAPGQPQVAPQNNHAAQPAPQYQAAPPPGQTQFVQPPPPPPPARKKSKRRNSPTADKYAKATGRALGAMFRGSGKKKPKGPPNP
jgi:hypothetical protein